MRFPTTIIEGRKIPRIVFSVQVSVPLDHQESSSLMKWLYEREVLCFDLPSSKHLESFRTLKHLVDDETLMGLSHLEAEEGVSFSGTPLHRFESKIVSTIRKNIIPHDLARNLLPSFPSSEVFTQKEIDRFIFDAPRFGKALSLLDPQESPFLLLGERYGDWLLALGRIDLLKEMVSRVREKGFIPIFSGQWTTFVLPKAKPLDVAAYAVPINQKWSFFDHLQACNLIKKFDRPVISLNPLADGKLFRKSREAFSFLFDELKIHSAIVGITSKIEANNILEVLNGIPSLILHRKT